MENRAGPCEWLQSPGSCPCPWSCWALPANRLTLGSGRASRALANGLWRGGLGQLATRTTVFLFYGPGSGGAQGGRKGNSKQMLRRPLSVKGAETQMA